MQNDARKRLESLFDGSFATNPFGSEFDVHKLQEPLPGYRLRIGDYRVLFKFEPGTITVYKIRQRKEAYR